jgi:hypothetical protein
LTYAEFKKRVGLIKDQVDSLIEDVYRIIRLENGDETFFAIFYMNSEFELRLKLTNAMFFEIDIRDSLEDVYMQEVLARFFSMRHKIVTWKQGASTDFPFTQDPEDLIAFKNYVKHLKDSDPKLPETRGD